MVTRLPRDIQDQLDILEPRIRAAFIASIENVTSAIRIDELIAMIRAGDIEGAVEALRLEQGFFGPLADAQRETFMSGGALAATSIPVRDPLTGRRIILGFDGRHDRAEEWLRVASSDLITEVIEDQKEMARVVLRQALEIGQHPRDTAREIVGFVNAVTGKREGGILGLDVARRDVHLAVMEGMKTAKGVRGLVVVPRGGGEPYVRYTSVNRATANRILAAYHRGTAVAPADIEISRKQLWNKLLKDRGDTIGRTESLNGLRAGRHEGFMQLVERGKVRDDQIEITWSATMDSRTRDSHRGLNGKKVRIGEFFEPAPGVRLQYPGDLRHSSDRKALAAEVIQCRCYASYRVKNDLLRDEP
ncbi:phage minor head protein [Pseudogemmobacter faecipullorum]|uniref:Phage head morphogenesis domain-containing protein n=1 Tax=Pseudogemmobacter faecipullorum TaxID=2755041 RepID=A0ABS8CQV2_9RHOB|nr:phage minor head protein [Pseudogemmobacter faecipullorum]MCB5411782.1 hypothetical protein [Pseudogemmobacter faecipullorum]